MKKLLLLLTLTMFASTSLADSCPSVLKFVKRKLNSQETVNLCDAYKGKAILVVNTASYCGYTPQFEGLESIYEKYKNDNFTVLGFPSHDFNQEYKDEGKTAELCELTYGVKFPMFEPTTVKGDEQDPLYRMLTKATGKAPSWNFNKYLIDAKGNIVNHYSSQVKPNDPVLVKDIEAAM